MGIVDKYGTIIKKTAPKHPKAAYRMLKGGLMYEKTRTGRFADKKVPAALRYLNNFAISDVLEALRHPGESVWANIFAPVEIIQCFGARVLSVEALSSILSGFTIEDQLLDFAEAEGMAPTLCSYHKNFIGAADSGIIPPARFALTTSTICDANLNTFRHLSQKHDVPFFLIDVPETYSKEAEKYVTDQLRDLIEQLEDTFGRKFDPEDLRLALGRENRCKKYYREFLKYAGYKDYPKTMTLQIFMLFASHLAIGTPEILKFYKMMAEEVKSAPDFEGIRILWVHLNPYYQETLKEYFNLSRDFQVQACEMDMDYMEPLDTEHPLEALSKKMINNLYTGSYERKAAFVKDMAKELGSDGVINFCHWGCKQSSGGAMILKDTLREADIPLLILDGDCIDRRNSHDGQIRTRFEAFAEMLRTRKEEKGAGEQ